jgi:hypothetical protein
MGEKTDAGSHGVNFANGIICSEYQISTLGRLK